MLVFQPYKNDHYGTITIFPSRLINSYNSCTFPKLMYYFNSGGKRDKMICDRNLFALRTSTNKLPNQNTCSFTQHQLAHQAFNYSVNCIQAAWGAAGELDTEALQRTRLDNPNKQRGRVPSKTHRACTHIHTHHRSPAHMTGRKTRVAIMPCHHAHHLLLR